jgi:hypothetical protein
MSPLRHLHSCSGCFRLERSPGGTCTHWKAPPCHGAHPKRPQRKAAWTKLPRQLARCRYIGNIAADEHDCSSTFEQDNEPGESRAGDANITEPRLEALLVCGAAFEKR